MMAIAITAFMALYLLALTYTLVAHFRGDHKLCKSLTAFLIVGSPAAIYSFTYPTDPALAFIQEPLRFFTFVALYVAPIAGLVALYNLLKDGSSASNVEKGSEDGVRPRRIRYMVDEGAESDSIGPSVSNSVETAAYIQRVLHAGQYRLTQVAEKSMFELKRFDIACMNVDGQAADMAGSLKSSETLVEKTHIRPKETRQAFSQNRATGSGSIQFYQRTGQQKPIQDNIGYGIAGRERKPAPNGMVLRDLLYVGDYVTIKRLTNKAKKILRVEGVVIDGKRHTDRIAYLRFQDWILLYRLRGGPIKKKPPPRQLHRLKSLNLIREDPEAIHLTERGRIVAEAFSMAMKKMTQGNADDSN